MFVLYIFTLLIVVIIASFLGKELLKKFEYISDYVQSTNQLCQWNYVYNAKRGIGMRNIEITGVKPFSILIGFKLDSSNTMTKFDPFGFVNSYNSRSIIIRVYLGRGNCLFGFVSNQNMRDNPLSVKIYEDNSPEIADVLFKPHWWQRLGIFS